MSASPIHFGSRVEATSNTPDSSKKDKRPTSPKQFDSIASASSDDKWDVQEESYTANQKRLSAPLPTDEAANGA